MNTAWLVYTGITVFYIALLIVYFWRRSRKHEQELKDFLSASKDQLDRHKKNVHNRTGKKLNQAMVLIQQLQKVAIRIDQQGKEEYKRITEQARTEAEKTLSEAKEQSRKVTENADKDFETYHTERQHEIEADMVRLVTSVTEKVIKRTLTEQDHYELIYQSLEEVKAQKEKM